MPKNQPLGGTHNSYGVHKDQNRPGEFSMHFVIVCEFSEHLAGQQGIPVPTHYEVCWYILVHLLLYHGLKDVLLLLLFILPACM